MHIQSDFKCSVPIVASPFISVDFFFLDGGTDGLTIGENVKRFYLAGELGKLTYLPLAWLIITFDQIKDHMFQLPLCPAYCSERKKGKKDRKIERRLRQDRYYVNLHII